MDRTNRTPIEHKMAKWNMPRLEALGLDLPASRKVQKNRGDHTLVSPAAV
jgi:hypothetical protein